MPGTTKNNNAFYSTLSDFKKGFSPPIDRLPTESGE